MTAAATEPLLGILKYVLLALLYPFFARVLWAVWSEVRTPTRRPMIGAPRGMAPTNPTSAAGNLGFVFTSQHADTEIGLDTGEFTRYDAEYAPALDCVFSK